MGKQVWNLTLYNLIDDNGNVVFTGTNKECVNFVGGGNAYSICVYCARGVRFGGYRVEIESKDVFRLFDVLKDGELIMTGNIHEVSQLTGITSGTLYKRIKSGEEYDGYTFRFSDSKTKYIKDKRKKESRCERIYQWLLSVENPTHNTIICKEPKKVLDYLESKGLKFKAEQRKDGRSKYYYVELLKEGNEDAKK